MPGREHHDRGAEARREHAERHARGGKPRARGGSVSNRSSLHERGDRTARRMAPVVGGLDARRSLQVAVDADGISSAEPADLDLDTDVRPGVEAAPSLRSRVRCRRRCSRCRRCAQPMRFRSRHHSQEWVRGNLLDVSLEANARVDVRLIHRGFGTAFRQEQTSERRGCELRTHRYASSVHSMIESIPTTVAAAAPRMTIDGPT